MNENTAASLRGRIGAYTLHSQGKTNTGPARAAFHSSFERRVDPDGTLPEGERLKRAEHARRAHFARLGLASAKARAARKAGGT